MATDTPVREYHWGLASWWLQVTRGDAGMPIRYMGTKRHMAHRVRRLIADLQPTGRVLDLFSGVGCVAESLADVAPVVTNDSLAFTALLARARLTAGVRHLASHEAIGALRTPYRDTVEVAVTGHRTRLREEQRAVDLGATALAAYMADARHVGNNAHIAARARAASLKTGPDRYCLATLYFAAGYFSLRQAIHLDALRYAIDSADLHDGDRDWLLAGWLGAAATVINAPGHTAQYLKPNTEQAYKRIRRSWRRNIWETFQDRLVELKPVGTAAWRRRNRVEVGDALDLLRSGRLSGVAAVYADPPYTKDQYSRYYHVYETLYRYDFPVSTGEARIRPDRFTSEFCLKSGVISAFTDLFESVAALGLPLVLSYPSDGLLTRAGSSVAAAATNRMTFTTIESLDTEHSTLGASKGAKTKTAMENLYVCLPA